MPGRAGVTHCGSWTRNRWPEDTYTTRVVCTQPPGHTDDHHNHELGITWPQKEKK